MFAKTFDQMQDYSRQWAALGRKMTGEALEATSQSLESAARYLKDLGARLSVAEAEQGSDGETAEAEPAAAERERDPTAGAAS